MLVLSVQNASVCFSLVNRLTGISFSTCVSLSSSLSSVSGISCLLELVFLLTETIAAKMEAKKTHVYIPLVEPNKSIRLIAILSVAPRICCVSSVFSIEEPPAFSALSYMWGDAAVTDTITLDGATLNVTTNLVHAIQHLHREWNQQGLTNDGNKQWLWADAVCINQEDAIEKDHQVPLMKVIYSRAKMVFSWLGDETGELGGAIDALNMVHNQISRLPGYDYILAKTNGGTYQLPSLSDLVEELGQEGLVGLTDLGWLVTHYQAGSDSALPVQVFARIQLLFGLKYWRRLWILQELVLAQNITLLCGSKKSSWDALSRVTFWRGLISLVHEQSDLPKCMSQWEWHCLMRPKMSNWCDIVRRAKQARGDKAVITHPPFQRGSMIVIVETNLHEAIQLLKNGFLVTTLATRHEATNPKDYIYAMAGVSGIYVPPRYSPEVTAGRVYQEYISVWLFVVAEAEKTEWRSESSVLCDLWFLKMAGVGYPWKEVADATSWVPNFPALAETGDSLDPAIRCANFAMTDGRADTGVFPRDTCIPKLDKTVLHCTGILIGEVSEMGPPIYAHEPIHDREPESDLWLLWIFDIAVKSMTVNPTGWAALAAMRRVLFFAHDSKSQYGYDLLLSLLIGDMAYVCERRRACDYATTFSALNMDLPAQKMTYLEQAVSLRDRHQRFLQLAVHMFGSTAYTHGFLNGYTTYAGAYAGTEKLRMAIVKAKPVLIGMFPPFTRTGDLVYVLKGCELPVILRKNDDGYFHVGACYIDRIMNGEAGDMLRKGQLKLEDIRIY
jgi:hypothetical protein